METLGQFLTREREFRGISHDQLHRSTRISHSMIRILEGDLPVPAHQSIYIRSFLKNYARHVGLDAGEIVSRYESERGEKNVSATPLAVSEPQPGASRMILIVLVVTALLGLAAYWAKR